MKKIISISIWLLVIQAACAQTNKIVFVCEHGSAKSVIAATYFNKLAKENNLPWQAVARGTSPDQSISPKTKQLLVEDNLFDKNFVPQKLSQQDVNVAKQVILFYELPKTIQPKDNIQSWQEVQAQNEDFKKLRDDIVSKITPLIDSLKTVKH
jgi:arsenate reductase (thioredoxin)